MDFNLNKLKKMLINSPEVAAAYLFGSAVKNEMVVNDLDILILLYPEINMHSIYLDLTDRIAKSLDISIDKVDVLFFDLNAAEPEVLYEAINNGILLKNKSPKLLTDKIESLSRYFLGNEPLLREAKLLEQQRLEEFIADRHE